MSRLVPTYTLAFLFLLAPAFALNGHAVARAADHASPPAPPGPALGRVRYVAELGADDAFEGAPPDTDDFVGRLARGERLDVTLRTHAKGGARRAAFDVIGPDGSPLAPVSRANSSGTRLALRGFVCAATGAYVVRVRQAHDTDAGAPLRYTLRVTTTRAVRRLLRDAAETDVTAGLAWFDVPALEGGTLRLTAHRGAVTAVRAPDGRDAGFDGGGRHATVPLLGGDGEYRVAVTVRDPARPPRLRVRFRAPPRPHGRVLLGAEPQLLPVSDPEVAAPGAVATLRGRGFDALTRVRVTLSGRPAAVIASNDAGTRLEVVVPSDAELGPLDATVVNADDQFALATGALLCDRPRPTSLTGILPRDVRLPVSVVQPFTAYLDAPAAKDGLTLRVSTSGAVLHAPVTVEVAPGASAARFDAQLAGDPGVGELRVELGGGASGPAVTARVELVAPGDPDAPPPDDPDGTPVPGSVDLSGWQLRQTRSDRTFVFPPGTRLDPGGVVLVCRSASRSAFEAFFGAALPEGVSFLSGAGGFPTLNGDETFALFTSAGAPADGPTIPLPPGGGIALGRIPGSAASDAAAWTTSLAPREQATPGAVAAGGSAPFLSEVCDPPGAGNYVYEYVEVAFGR